MKVKKLVVMELHLEEVLALLKLLGNVPHEQMQTKFGLSQEQVRSLSAMWDELCWVEEEDRDEN